jgi:hypothetical protein
MLDETLMTATPPLSSCSGRLGQQGRLLSTGQRARRVLHGVLNIRPSASALLRPAPWDQDTHPYCLTMVRSQWRAWPIVLCEDRGAPHPAEESREVAAAVPIALRLLPVATPELNAMDHLWQPVKSCGLVKRATVSSDTSADMACQYRLALRPRERLRKAGVLSGHFWLTLCCVTALFTDYLGVGQPAYPLEPGGVPAGGRVVPETF